MTGSEFIRKLTELTKAGKVKWEDEQIPFCKSYKLVWSGLRIEVDDTTTKIYIHSNVVRRQESGDLFNAISDTMPDIQTLFDNAIKELEK